MAIKSDPLEKEFVIGSKKMNGGMKLRLPSFKPRITVRPKKEIGVPKVRINKGLGGLMPKVKRF